VSKLFPSTLDSIVKRTRVNAKQLFVMNPPQKSIVFLSASATAFALYTSIGMAVRDVHFCVAKVNMYMAPKMAPECMLRIPHSNTMLLVIISVRLYF
jgi:hypothetical protein